MLDVKTCVEMVHSTFREQLPVWGTAGGKFHLRVAGVVKQDVVVGCCYS